MSITATTAWLPLEHGVTDFYQGATLALVPALVTGAGYDLAHAGGVVLAATILSSVAQPAFGALADRRPLPWLRPAGLLLAGTGIGAVGLMGSYLMVCAAVLISGLGVAAYHPQAARAVHARRAGDSAVGWFSFGGIAGYSAGPVVTTAVIAGLGLTATPLLVLPAALAAAAHLHRRTPAAAPPSRHATPGPEGSEGADDWPRFSGLTAIVVLRSVTYYALTTLLVVHLTTQRGLSLALATTALTVFTATGAAATLLGGYLTRRAPRTVVIAGSYLLTTPAIIGVATATGPAAILPCAALLGLGMHVPVALHTTLGQHLLPRHVGTAAGVTLGLSVSVGGLAAPLAGAAAQHVGTTTTLLTVAALPLAAAAATAALVHPRTVSRAIQHAALARLQLPATLTDELTTLAQTQDRRVDTVLHDAITDYLATHPTPKPASTNHARTGA